MTETGEGDVDDRPCRGMTPRHTSHCGRGPGPGTSVGVEVDEATCVLSEEAAGTRERFRRDEPPLHVGIPSPWSGSGHKRTHQTSGVFYCREIREGPSAPLGPGGPGGGQ